MSRFERFHVVTGGPGSGKTTLIEALARRGYAHTVEAGRAIIQDQTAIDGPVFFDRGVADLVG
jgi:predicted ATPase